MFSSQVARIGIITAANSDPLSSGIYYEDMFLSYNAAEVMFILSNLDPNLHYRLFGFLSRLMIRILLRARTMLSW